MSIYTSWLPPATAAAAREKDVPTFEAAAMAFVRQWEEGKAAAEAEAARGAAAATTAGAGGAAVSSSTSQQRPPVLPHERALETLPWVSVFNK